MTQTAKLTASDGAASDCFGSSVAISGDTVVVGAILMTLAQTSNQGSAYVFVKPAGGWADYDADGQSSRPRMARQMIISALP